MHRNLRIVIVLTISALLPYTRGSVEELRVSAPFQNLADSLKPLAGRYALRGVAFPVRERTPPN